MSIARQKILSHCVNMNSGIFVCVLGLLICHVTICSGVPRLTGDCTLEDVEPEYRSSCMDVSCFRDENGKVRTVKIECGLVAPQCNGKDFKATTNDSLTYPDCCVQIQCL
ncbi:uncharacterized protein [Venturia canescens]|uniref:uncharacterized protein n=1 Tax=Venturia canescens TaxID=32260 RepID=UPI001C9C442E|nr:uncharacterized protein LOC122412282 [Venturia canescens]